MTIKEKRKYLTVDEALEVIPEGNEIHTFYLNDPPKMVHRSTYM